MDVVWIESMQHLNFSLGRTTLGALALFFVFGSVHSDVDAARSGKKVLYRQNKLSKRDAHASYGQRLAKLKKKAASAIRRDAKSKKLDDQSSLDAKSVRSPYGYLTHVMRMASGKKGSAFLRLPDSPMAYGIAASHIDGIVTDGKSMTLTWKDGLKFTTDKYFSIVGTKASFIVKPSDSFLTDIE